MTSHITALYYNSQKHLLYLVIHYNKIIIDRKKPKAAVTYPLRIDS